MSEKRLLTIIYENPPDLLEQVRRYIAAGADLDAVTEYGESALRVASNNGRFDVVALLLASGADKSQLKWTASIEETVFGTLDSLRASVLAHGDLEVADFWQRTPFLFAVLIGDRDKAQLLLELGADPCAVGRCGKLPSFYAIQNDDVAMLQWLVDQGFDMEACDDFQRTALMEAADRRKAASVRFLAELGVDIYKTGNTSQRALQMTQSSEVVRILCEYGDELSDMSDEAHADMLGVESDGYPTIDAKAYHRDKHRKFGDANPQRVTAPFWLDMIQTSASGWRARDKFGEPFKSPPVWSYRRFGRTTTILPDGRIIEIGGEHEDHYDPDFCIYNDVTVFDGKGGITMLTYPADVFPPTDFHAATLVGEAVYVIGRLGYPADRRIGETPVFKLDLKTFSIKEVKARGECPGWIYRHKARLDGDAGIIVRGGERLVNIGGKEEEIENMDQYRLCLKTHVWSRLPSP